MKQKNQNGQLKTTEIFNSTNTQNHFYGVPRMGRNFDDHPDFQQKARGYYEKHCRNKSCMLEIANVLPAK